MCPFSPLSTTCGTVVPGPSALESLGSGRRSQLRKRERQRVCTVEHGGSLLFLRWFGGSGSLHSKRMCRVFAVAPCSCMELWVIVWNWGQELHSVPRARRSPCLLNLEWFQSLAARGQPGRCVQLTQGPLSPRSSPGVHTRCQLLYPQISSTRSQ